MEATIHFYGKTALGICISGFGHRFVKVTLQDLKKCKKVHQHNFVLKIIHYLNIPEAFKSLQKCTSKLFDFFCIIFQKIYTFFQKKTAAHFHVSSLKGKISPQKDCPYLEQSIYSCRNRITSKLIQVRNRNLFKITAAFAQ